MENSANNGLEPLIVGFEEMYTNTAYGIDGIMSRSDFWQLAATVAIDLGITIANRNCDEDT